MIYTLVVDGDNGEKCVVDEDDLFWEKKIWSNFVNTRGDVVDKGERDDFWWWCLMIVAWWFMICGGGW